MTPEKKVQNEIIKYLRRLQLEGLPIYFERRQAGGFNYKKGIPDLYAIYNGIHIEIEVKQTAGQRTIMQEQWEQLCKRNNILYICTDNIEQFKNFIKNQFNV